MGSSDSNNCSSFTLDKGDIASLISRLTYNLRNSLKFANFSTVFSQNLVLLQAIDGATSTPGAMQRSKCNGPYLMKY